MKRPQLIARAVSTLGGSTALPIASPANHQRISAAYMAMSKSWTDYKEQITDDRLGLGITCFSVVGGLSSVVVYRHALHGGGWGPVASPVFKTAWAADRSPEGSTPFLLRRIHKACSVDQ